VELTELAARASAVLDEVERAVVGKRDRLELVLAGLLADGHVLLDDVPGLAKTLTARSFASVTGLRFTRVQFTPDLLPTDVTGSSIWNQRALEFEFRAGPVFTNLLLADEINRAPPKTQAALLEAMQERQVSVDGSTHVLEAPFLVLATQNPIEYEGTYPLPEAQLLQLRPDLPQAGPRQVVEQVVAVLGDLEKPLRELAPLDRRAGAPAAAVDHLLVGEHRLVDRIPIEP